MSVEIDSQVVDHGNDDHAEEAWELKERIRREEGVLKQRRGFFMDAYRRSRVVIYRVDGDLVAFSSTRRDGYILFLAVAPEWRDEGFGKRLIAEIADVHRVVTCHARATNRDALGFYESVGFSRVRRIDNYYEDGGDAFYLKLGESSSLRERLSELLGR